MDFQEMKQLLISYPNLSRKIFYAQEEIKRYKAAAQGIMEELKSPVVNGMPHGTELSDPTYQKVQQAIDIYETRILILANNLVEYQEKQAKLFDLLQCLDNDEYRIIEMRYLKGLNWNHIPPSVNYSQRRCFDIHDRAIYKLVNNIL